MRKLVSASTLLAFLVCWPAAGKEWARKMFETRSHDFGSVARGAKAVYEFPLENIYGEDIRIAGVRSSCGCTTPSIKYNKRLLKPKETGVIVASILDQLFKREKPVGQKAIRAAVVEGAQRRIRPAMMTTATTILALLPVLMSTGRGADVMVPMAIPTFGGMTVAVVTVFVVPVLYCGVKEWGSRGKRM